MVKPNKTIQYKKRPKYGKYVYEYVFETRDGKVIWYLGKNKYYIIYRRKNEYYAINKSNGKSISYRGYITPITFQEISKTIDKKHPRIIKHVKYYSLENFSYFQMYNLVKTSNVSKDEQELKKKIHTDQQHLNALKEDSLKISMQMIHLRRCIEEQNQLLKKIKQEKICKNSHEIQLP